MSAGDKILVVDDESDIRLILSMILKKDGYNTIEAANGWECLQRILETDLDLVILDIMSLLEPFYPSQDVNMASKLNPRVVCRLKDVNFFTLF